MRNVSTVQNRPTADKTLLSSNRRSINHKTFRKLLHGFYHRPPPGKRTRRNPRGSRSRVNKRNNSCPMFKNDHRRENCATIIGKLVQTIWTPGQDNIRSRTPVHVEDLCGTTETARNQIVVIYRIPPPNGWNHREG